jgi:hypothetical protein
VKSNSVSHTTKKEQNKLIFCNRCGNETNHQCVTKHYRDYPNYTDGQLAFVERLGYRFWICLGCESGTLEEYYILDSSSDEDENKKMEEITYFPERAQFHVKEKIFNQLPKKLGAIYRETLRAFNNNLEILCALGVRGLLEGICADKGITGVTLAVRIDNMVRILPQNIITNLHSIRFIGNEAAHELASPPKEELKIAIEICEDILNFLYEFDYKARQLSMKHNSGKSKAKAGMKTAKPEEGPDDIPF